MKLKFMLRIGLLLGIGLGTSACYFTSVNSLPMKPEFDKELLGWWQTVPDEGKSPQTLGHFLFLEDKNGFFHVILMEKNYAFDEWYRGFCSEINGEKYLNLRQISPGDGKQMPTMDKEYYLVHYKIIDHRRLETALLNEETFKQAIKNHKLKGTISARGDDFTVTDSSENLAAFFQSCKIQELLDKDLNPAERVVTLPEPKITEP
jgi:hypothetical protein